MSSNSRGFATLCTAAIMAFAMFGGTPASAGAGYCPTGAVNCPASGNTTRVLDVRAAWAAQSGSEAYSASNRDNVNRQVADIADDIADGFLEVKANRNTCGDGGCPAHSTRANLSARSGSLRAVRTQMEFTGKGPFHAVQDVRASGGIAAQVFVDR